MLSVVGTCFQLDAFQSHHSVLNTTIQPKYNLYLMARFVIFLNTYMLPPIALRKAKIMYNFGLSECNRVKALSFGWMDDLLFYILSNSISVISVKCVDDDERLCAMEPVYGCEDFTQVGLELRTSRSVGECFTH